MCGATEAKEMVGFCESGEDLAYDAVVLNCEEKWQGY